MPLRLWGRLPNRTPGNTSSPLSRNPSTSGPSLKFCANQDARTTVQSAPDPRNASLVGRARSSPRDDSSTSRRTPNPTASCASSPTARPASGAPTSEGYTRYAASAPRNVSAHVDRSAQSNPRAREASRTVSPAARAASATRRPVRPEAPVTTIVMFRAFCVMPSSQRPCASIDHR